jgi:outer membrane protein TolC
MNSGGFNVAQVVNASETGVVAEGSENRESELQQLLAERKKVLTRIVESTKLFYESGRVGIEEYRDANIALLRAEIEMCSTRNERLEILQKMIQLNKEVEAQITRRASEGRATGMEVNKAKAARLEAQIELARENLKE